MVCVHFCTLDSSLSWEKFVISTDLTGLNLFKKITTMREVSDRTAFLSRSHFQISQDNAVTDPCLESVFKRDFPPLWIHGRPSAIDPPPPVQFHHFDDR